MKIVAIIASDSHEEPAARMAWLALKHMQAQGVAVEAIYIGSQASLPCCREGNDISAASADCTDFIAGLVQKLEAADGFFLAAPVVAGGLASAMSAFLERVALLGSTRPHFLRGKVGGTFVTGGHVGGMQAIYQVVNFFYMTEAIFTWARYWPMSWENEGVDTPENDEEAIETIDDLARQMVWMLKVLS